MTIYSFPKWMRELSEEDLIFIKRFLLASGSLKEIAKEYRVTYPTVRVRLNRLTEKIQLTDTDAEDSYISLIKRMVIDEQIEFDAAKILIAEYKKQKGENEMSYLKEIILIILFGIVILTVVKFQIYLSKKEKPFYGLILPIFSFSAVLSGYLLLTPASFETSENFTTDMACRLR